MAESQYRKDLNEASREVVPTGWFALRVLLVVMAVCAAVGIVGYPLGWFSEAAKVTQQEFGPKAALDKYSWFIDQASRIKKMDADLKIFEGRIAGIEKQYEAYGADKSKWPPHVQGSYNQAAQQVRDDLAAMTSLRNSLARDYNAASEKFHWAPFQSKADKPEERFSEYRT